MEETKQTIEIHVRSSTNIHDVNPTITERAAETGTTIKREEQVQEFHQQDYVEVDLNPITTLNKPKATPTKGAKESAKKNGNTPLPQVEVEVAVSSEPPKQQWSNSKKKLVGALIFVIICLLIAGAILLALYLQKKYAPSATPRESVITILGGNGSDIMTTTHVKYEDNNIFSRNVNADLTVTTIQKKSKTSRRMLQDGSTTDQIYKETTIQYTHKGTQMTLSYTSESDLPQIKIAVDTGVQYVLENQAGYVPPADQTINLTASVDLSNDLIRNLQELITPPDALTYEAALEDTRLATESILQELAGSGVKVSASIQESYDSIVDPVTGVLKLVTTDDTNVDDLIAQTSNDLLKTNEVPVVANTSSEASVMDGLTQIMKNITLEVNEIMKKSGQMIANSVGGSLKRSKRTNNTEARTYIDRCTELSSTRRRCSREAYTSGALKVDWGNGEPIVVPEIVATQVSAPTA